MIASIRSDPNARWLGMGDMCEFISPTDTRRWNAADLDKSVVSLDCEGHVSDVYVRKMAAKLKPIASQCIGYLAGNHERAWQKYHGSDVSWRVLELMGLANEEDEESSPPLYSPGACLTRIVFQHSTRDRCLPVKVYASHGWQAGRQEGGKVNESRRLLAYLDADIYLNGHSHSKWVVPQTRLSTDVRFTKLTAHEVYTAHTGSFLRTLQQDHTGYAETAGYPPTSTGVVRFKLRPVEDRVEISAVM